MTKINSNGISINYEIQGEGEPLVLLMGLGAYSRKWEPHVNVYSRHFKCILIDNRGSGKSDKPQMKEYSTEMMAEDTIGVLDALGIKRAHFHGISMGGAIAQIIAAKYPERVQSLILTSTFAKADNYFKRAMEILRDSVGILDGTTFCHLSQYMIYSPSYYETNMRDILQAEEEDSADPLPMPDYAYRAQCYACMNHDACSILKDITAPTLVAAGGKDLFVSQASTQQLLDGIPNSELYLCENGGHVHHWEYLDEFNQATLAFLDAHRKEGE